MRDLHQVHALIVQRPSDLNALLELDRNPCLRSPLHLLVEQLLIERLVVEDAAIGPAHPPVEPKQPVDQGEKRRQDFQLRALAGPKIADFSVEGVQRDPRREQKPIIARYDLQ